MLILRVTKVSWFVVEVDAMTAMVRPGRVSYKLSGDEVQSVSQVGEVREMDCSVLSTGVLRRIEELGRR
jgi:hypothetical protein